MLRGRGLARRAAPRPPVVPAVEFPLMHLTFDGLSLAAPSGGYQAINGVDSNSGWNMTNDRVFGARPRIQPLNTTVLAEIVSGAGHNGNTKNLLHLKLTSQDSSISQCPLLLEPTTNPAEFYIKAWHKLPANLAAILGGGGWLLVGPEFKTGPDGVANLNGDFRILNEVNITGSTPMWNLKWDNNANGGLPPDGILHDLRPSNPGQVAGVPQGVWYQAEFYVKRHETAGRSWFKVNGTTIFDLTGDTIGVNSARINRIFLGNAYANTGVAEVWIDEVEIWDHIPGTAPVGGGGVSKTLFLNTGANSALTSFHDLGATQVNSPSDGGGNVSSGGTEFLLTNGTLQAQFVSGRAPIGGFSMPSGGAVGFSISGSDPNNAGTAHYKFRAKLFKRTSAGAESLIGTFDDDAALTAGNGLVWTWAGTMASTVLFAEDDRLVMRLYVIPASGGTLTGGWVSFGTGDAGWLSSMSITTAAPVTFKAEA